MTTKNENIGTRIVCTIEAYGKNNNLRWTDVKSVNDIKATISAENGIYYFVIKLTEENYNINTGFSTQILNTQSRTVWVSNEVTTPKQIQQQYQGVEFHPEITKKNENSFAIKTTTNKQQLFAKTHGHKIVPVSEKVVEHWRPIDAKKDIVVDYDLRQIFPKKTNQMPYFLKKMLQNVR